MSLTSINTHCPFSGKLVESDSITTYEGVEIGFCNPCCRNDFAKDPHKYPQVLAEYFPDSRMHVYEGATFTSETEWGSQHIANMAGTSIKIHATSTPYHWHVNSGQEVFVVLDGEVNMHYRKENGVETQVLLTTGMIAHFEEGAEHMAHPKGLARILVMERLGSE